TGRGGGDVRRAHRADLQAQPVNRKSAARAFRSASRRLIGYAPLRQSKRKRRSLSRCGFEPELAAVAFDNRFGDAEAEAGAAFVAGRGSVGLGKLFEDAGLELRRDSPALIGDRDAQPIAGALGADLDGAAAR